MVNKVEKDGKVAVLVSVDYGAGWSTWNSGQAEALVYSPELVEAVLNNCTPAEITALAEKLFPDVYTGGAGKLKVYWGG